MLNNVVFICVLLIIVGFGSFSLCVISCWCCFFSVVICECVIVQCSSLYCVMGRFSCYFSFSCRSGFTMLSAVPETSGPVELCNCAYALTISCSNSYYGGGKINLNNIMNWSIVTGWELGRKTRLCRAGINKIDDNLPPRIYILIQVSVGFHPKLFQILYQAYS